MFIYHIISHLIANYRVTLPSNFNSIFSSLVFLSFSAAILYSVGSSIFGITPDKLPYVSERVNSVLPTVDQLKEMLEEEERRAKMTPEERRKELEEQMNKERIERKRRGEKEDENNENDDPQ